MPSILGQEEEFREMIRLEKTTGQTATYRDNSYYKSLVHAEQSRVTVTEKNGSYNALVGARVVGSASEEMVKYMAQHKSLLDVIQGRMVKYYEKEHRGIRTRREKDNPCQNDHCVCVGKSMCLHST